METLKWEYTSATDVFTKLGSLLSVTSRHCLCRDMTTSVHAISGHVISDRHDSGLHNCTLSSYYVQAVRTENRSKSQFGSNVLLFTPFMTVSELPSCDQK